MTTSNAVKLILLGYYQLYYIIENQLKIDISTRVISYDYLSILLSDK